MPVVVVLDVIEPDGSLPPYCVHGRCTCSGPGCTEWCWLGDQTLEIVERGQAEPLCKRCADRIWPDAAQRGMLPIPVGQIEDHRRADGPH